MLLLWLLANIAWLRNHQLSGEALVFVVLNPQIDSYLDSAVDNTAYWPDVVLINGPQWARSMPVQDPSWANVVRASIEYAQLADYSRANPHWKSVVILFSDRNHADIAALLTKPTAPVFDKDYVVIPREIVEDADAMRCRRVRDDDELIKCLLTSA